VSKDPRSSARAAEGPGDYRDQHSADLALRLVSELGPDWCEDHPVQQARRAARTEDQLLVFRLGKICPQNSEGGGANLIEAATEPIPSLRRIDSDPRH